MNGWTFLVARGRHKGYRTVLAPDFLVVRNLHSLLSASTDGNSPEAGGRRVVEIDNSEVGYLSLIYRTEQLRPGELGDLDNDDRIVLDEHGRPLELLYGVVFRHQPPSSVDERDLQRAREEALGSYRFFLAAEDTFQVDVSSSFSLRGPRAFAPSSDIGFPASDSLGAAEIARPVAEVPGAPACGSEQGAAASPSTKARRRKIGSGGAAVIAGVALVALLFIWWTLPDSDINVVVTVRPDNESDCAESRTLMGTITAREPGNVIYHWERPTEFGGRLGQGAWEFKTAGVQHVEVGVPSEPGGRRVQTGTYFLVIDQPEKLRQEVVVGCKE